ncbi:MAG TPA: hypothetical protein VGE01_06515, partial [Fimbriimonas sp.]
RRGGANPGIYLRDVSDGTESLLLSGNQYRDPQWGPYPTKRNLIGPGGTLGTASGGFIFGQVGDRLKSFVSFDATTRSTLVVTPQANPNPYQANAVCTVSADSMKMLKYFNDLAGGVVAVVGSADPVSGAVVSFNADTGRVSSVIPYKAAAATRTRDALAYKGEFTGAWDDKGKNRAPNGATEVTLDPNTGELLSVR